MPNAPSESFPRNSYNLNNLLHSRPHHVAPASGQAIQRLEHDFSHSYRIHPGFHSQY